MRRSALAIFMLSLVIANQSRAGLTPVSPFSGILSETWESFPLTGPFEICLSDPTVIMGGSASISHPCMFTYEEGQTQSLGSSGYAVPSDGVKLMGIGGSFQTPETLTFTDPIQRFGAFWGGATFGDPALIEVRFFDETDFLIGTDVVSYSRPGDGVLEWHGWTSNIAIKKISYTVEDGAVIDGLQANPVPEPAALALILPSLYFVRRRKR